MSGNDLQLYESQQLKVMVEVANAFPRELDTFVDDVYTEVMKDVQTNKEFAMSCIYCVPVGKDDNGAQKFISDPSVRITEVMQKYWKHLRIIVNGVIDGDELIVNGLIVDCQANNAETLVDRVNCKKWTDRRKTLKLKAMQSIMKRDLRLSIMGKAYANQLKNKIFAGLFPDIPEGWKFCTEAFKKNFNVEEKTLLNYFKIDSSVEVTGEILFNSLGMYNYLRENDEEPEKVFGSGKKQNKPHVKPADVKISDASKEEKKENPKIDFSDDKKFNEAIFTQALQAGLSETDVANELKKVCEVDHTDDVLPENRERVFFHFQGLANETPGA